MDTQIQRSITACLGKPTVLDQLEMGMRYTHTTKPGEQRSAHSLAQAWYATGSLGHKCMHAEREPPGQPAGDGRGLGGDGGVGGAGAGGAGGAGAGGAGGAGAGEHLAGSGPCTTEPFILKLLTEKWEPPRSP